MPIICLNCANTYPSDAPECIVCGRPAPDPDYPNIILASQKKESEELNKRYNAAKQLCDKNGTIDKILEFESLIEDESRLITACKFPRFLPFASWDNGIFGNFQKLLSIGMAFIDDDPINKVRSRAEEATLPGCSKDITFAALSIEDRGILSYGNYWCIWNLDMISHRTSTFHSNCVEWRNEIGIAIDAPMPEGFRSLWHSRHQLVIAKYYGDIADNTTFEEFSKILLKDRIDENHTDEFIECHIWGPISRRSLAKVIFTFKEETPGMKLMIKETIEQLRNIGVEVEEV